MQKLFIENRKGQKLCVLIEKSDDQKGLAFVMHGLGGFKEQDHIVVFAECFKEAGFTVIRFDTTNTYGESDGKYEDATTTNYYEDLEDVISWSKDQDWYEEPFCLAGHSLGGMSITLYAQKHPKIVKALAPISATISGKLSLEKAPEKFKKWKETGWHIAESESVPGVMKKLKWSHAVDRLKYDLLPPADRLTMPVLLIVGENDMPESQQLLFDKLPGEKEMHIIAGAPHTFRTEKHLKEVKEIMSAWVKKIKN